eukprot:343594_1
MTAWCLVLVLTISYVTAYLNYCSEFTIGDCRQCVHDTKTCETYFNSKSYMQQCKSTECMRYTGKICSSKPNPKKWITCTRTKADFDTFYMISSHGGEYEPTAKGAGTPWPYKSEVKFFVKSYEMLTQKRALPIQKLFESGNIKQLNKKTDESQTITKKKPINIHWALWGSEFESISGVYRIILDSKTKKVLQLSLISQIPSSTEKKPFVLTDIVKTIEKKYGPGTFYWNACRQKITEDYIQTNHGFKHTTPYAKALRLMPYPLINDEIHEWRQHVHAGTIALLHEFLDLRKKHLNTQIKNINELVNKHKAHPLYKEIQEAGAKWLKSLHEIAEIPSIYPKPSPWEMIKLQTKYFKLYKEEDLLRQYLYCRDEIDDILSGRELSSYRAPADAFSFQPPGPPSHSSESSTFEIKTKARESFPNKYDEYGNTKNRLVQRYTSIRRKKSKRNYYDGDKILELQELKSIFQGV